MGGNREGIRRK